MFFCEIIALYTVELTCDKTCILLQEHLFKYPNLVWLKPLVTLEIGITKCVTKHLREDPLLQQ